MTHRLTGRDIILGVLENMEEGLEPLLYSTLAPGIYDVYLHAADYERLAGILPLVLNEAQTGLDKALDALNQSRRLWKLPFQTQVKYQNPAGAWALAFHQNTDDEIKPGELVIESTLALPAKPEIGGGMGTKKIRTLRSGGASRVVSARYEPALVEPLASPRAFAHFAWQDKGGAHTYLMTTQQIVAGRGSTDYWVDLKLEASNAISREHFRLRRETATGDFFIRDLSLFGTAVNGVRLPSSVTQAAAGLRRDLNLEVPLPPQARLELAGLLTLEFAALEVQPI